MNIYRSYGKNKTGLSLFWTILQVSVAVTVRTTTKQLRRYFDYYWTGGESGLLHLTANRYQSSTSSGEQHRSSDKVYRTLLPT